MGLPTREETNTSSYCVSPRIYQPPAMDGLLECPRKKKMFSSSSFYEEPNCLYPTVQEQVKLCRQIAESLSDDCNLKSKGANMFFRRVKKAEKWIVAQSNGVSGGGGGDGDSADADPRQLPYVRPKKAAGLKLILDPRQIIDMRKLLEEGVDIVQHDAVSPEVCHNIVRDLNAQAGRGAQLFAKRKKKSEEWVVDDDKIRHLLQDRYPTGTCEEPHLVHPRVKELSGGGGVDSQSVVDSVLRAAEAKVMTYPNHVPHHPVIRPLIALDAAPPPTCTAPKGWAPPPAPQQEVVPPAKLEPPSSSPLSRTPSFTNFNTSPRAWNAQVPSPRAIKPVRPPSVLIGV